MFVMLMRGRHTDGKSSKQNPVIRPQVLDRAPSGSFLAYHGCEEARRCGAWGLAWGPS